MKLLQTYKIKPELESQYSKARVDENSVRILLMTYMALIFGTLLSLQHYFFPIERIHGQYNNEIRYIYLSYIVSGLIVFFVIRNLRLLSFRAKNLVHIFISLLYLSLGLLFGVVQYSTNHNFVAFITTILVFNMLYRSTFIVSVLFQLYSIFFYSLGAMLLSNTMPAVDYFRMFMLSLVGIFVWWGQDRLWKDNFLVHIDLERKIKDEENAKKELHLIQKQLVETAHKAGMAEIAADTLHNVGNVLNSVKTSTHLIKKEVQKNLAGSLSKACSLLNEHRPDLHDFIQNDEKGKQLIDYLFFLDKELSNSHSMILEQVDRLNNKTNTISDVILAQQYAANYGSYNEPVNLEEVVNTSLAAVPELREIRAIDIQKQLEPVPQLTLPKLSLLHTIINIVHNASHALSHSTSHPKILQVRLFQSKQTVILEISDNGYGIAPENLEKIFFHGFTTKEKGLGFGLHSCANHIQDMGAKIEVQSEGIGKGACFRLLFPIHL